MLSRRWHEEDAVVFQGLEAQGSVCQVFSPDCSQSWDGGWGDGEGDEVVAFGGGFEGGGDEGAEDAVGEEELLGEVFSFEDVGIVLDDDAKGFVGSGMVRDDGPGFSHGKDAWCCD